MSSTPWQYGPRTFVVDGTDATLVELNVIHRGTLRGLTMQLADAVNGTFTIYNSEAAAIAAASDLNGGSMAYDEGEPQYPAFSVLTGSLTAGRYMAHDLNVPYLNADGTPTNPVARLWMVVQLAGGGDTQLSIGMTIMGASLNG